MCVECTHRREECAASLSLSSSTMAPIFRAKDDNIQRSRVERTRARFICATPTLDKPIAMRAPSSKCVVQHVNIAPSSSRAPSAAQVLHSTNARLLRYTPSTRHPPPALHRFEIVPAVSSRPHSAQSKVAVPLPNALKMHSLSLAFHYSHYTKHATHTHTQRTIS